MFHWLSAPDKVDCLKNSWHTVSSCWKTSLIPLDLQRRLNSENIVYLERRRLPLLLLQSALFHLQLWREKICQRGTKRWRAAGDLWCDWPCLGRASASLRRLVRLSAPSWLRMPGSISVSCLVSAWPVMVKVLAAREACTLGLLKWMTVPWFVNMLTCKAQCKLRVGAQHRHSSVERCRDYMQVGGWAHLLDAGDVVHAEFL